MLIEHLSKEFPEQQNVCEHIFGGLWFNVLNCECSLVTHTEITEMPGIIPLELYGNNIQDSFDHLFWSEELERRCTSCTSEMCGKTSKIFLEPSTLILQLKRYEYSRNEQKSTKINKKMMCPKTLNLPSGSTYSLCSVVNHIGETPAEGHYNVLIQNKREDSFVLLDDTSIQFVQLEMI